MSLAFKPKSKSFEKLITETNTFLNAYSDLSAFGSDDYIALSSSGLPKKTIKHIQKNHEEYEGYTKDSISKFSLIQEYQELIFENLNAIVLHPQFKTSRIENLLNQGSDLSVVVSEDRKLYNFSLDEKTGGSYRSRISLTHYTEDSLVSYQKNENDHEAFYNQHSIFEGDGFTGIYTLSTKEGTKYLLTGYVRGCSYCFETSAMVVSYQNGAFNQEFYYAVNSRSWEEGVVYDTASKTITVDYVTDDLTPDCGCSSQEENLYADDSDGKITKRCHCTFQFNGSKFELVKASWEKLKK